MIVMSYSDQTSLIPVPSVNIRRTLPAGWIHGEQITTYAEHLQGQQDTIEQKILLLPTVFMDRLEKKKYRQARLRFRTADSERSGALHAPQHVFSIQK